jgi:3D (Asp-Asp-Asp) domain-containing protein
MLKLTAIKYLKRHPQTANFPKYIAMAGLLFSMLSPLQSIAQTGIFQIGKPTLLAMGEMRPFFSSGQMTEPEKPSYELTFINGSSLLSRNNPSIEIENSQARPAAKNSKAIIATSYQKLSVIESQNISDVRREVIVTAYSSTVDQCDDTPFITAKGTRVRDGIVAANWLKFGTKIRLPEFSGDKIYVVEDRMAKKNSHKLDIWMESRELALQFGVRRLTVEVLE